MSTTSPVTVNVRSVTIISSNGRSFDAVNLFNEIELRESLYSTSINGSITIKDDHDHWEVLPIIGQETIQFKFSFLNDVIIRMNFAVYKISDIKKRTARSSEYTLYFTSEEQMLNVNRRVNRSFASMNYNKMMELILQEEIGTTKEFEIQPTLNKGTYVAPNIRPFKAINQLCKLSVSSDDERSNYVFFEDRRGYIAAPILSLALQKPKYTYTYAEDISNIERESPVFDPMVIFALDVKKQNDTLKLLSDGFFASQLYTIDPIQRKVHQYEYDYFSEFNSSEHMNRYKIYEPEEFFEGDGNQYFTYSNEGISDNSYVNDHDSSIIEEQSSMTRLRRRIQTLLFSNYILNMSIPGNPFLYIGDVIKIELPSTTNKEERKLNRAIKGNNMVSAITHILNASGNYIQRIETIKDSVAEDLKGNP